MDKITAKYVTTLWAKDNYSYNICKISATDKVPEEFLNKGGSLNYCLKGENLPVEKAEYFGTWEKGQNGKSCFKVVGFSLAIPDNKKGLIKFLSGSNFKGIGKGTAKKVVDAFGLDSVDTILNKIEDVREIIGEKKAETLRKGLIANKTVSDIYEYIGDYSIPLRYIKAIAREYGEKSVEAIKENPYILVNIQNVGLTACDKIAASTKSPVYFTTERVKAGISYVLNFAVEGMKKLYLPEYELKKKVKDTLDKLDAFHTPDSEVDDVKYDASIKELISDKTIVIKDGNVALKWVDDIEFYTAKNIVNVLTSLPLDSNYQRKYQNYFRNNSECQNLSKGQMIAILKFVENRVSVITGGPGTGKTTVLKNIIKAYEKCENGNVVLLTPTGKAARRVTEATGYHATTIHSRLGIYAEDGHANCDVITDSLVIVDEMSMVDAFLMNSLMRNINEDCHVVFVGDVNQLPSVSAGDVLRDLINSGIIPVTYLTENFRQKGNGQTIINNSFTINDGRYSLEYDDSFEAISASTEKDTTEKVFEAYKKEIETFGVENVAVLSPLRQTFNGRFTATSEGLNPLLREVANSNHELTDKGLPFNVGDRVMQTKNCENSSNGDIGTVIGYYNEKYEIEWESHPDYHEFIDMEDITKIVLAYSYSVHKSQGAETDCIIIPLSPEQKQMPIFRRNLIYTAVTRAKKKVILVGSANILKQAVENNANEVRNTTLAKKIHEQFSYVQHRMSFGGGK